MWYKGPTRAITGASFGIPLLMHKGFVSHKDFAEVRTDLKPYMYLVSNGTEVRKYVDMWIADRVLWQKAKRHAFELSRCYHSALVVDMYVRVFSYLIGKKFNDTRFVASELTKNHNYPYEKGLINYPFLTALIVYMYVLVFSYLIGKKFNDTRFVASELTEIQL